MRFLTRYGTRGFTLLEVMVALIIGTVIVGGVMGLISMSLQYSQRVKERSQFQPILEAAAQQIMAHPELAEAGALALPDFPDAPPVNIALAKVTGADGEDVQNRTGQLYRVLLSCRGQVLELSLIIPQSQFK